MKIAFIVPRFDSDIAGGAETLVRELCVRIKDIHQIEVFTTCAKDNRTWDNFYAPGVTEVSGIKTTRFLVDKRDLESWVPLQIAISQGTKVDLDQELTWLEHSVNSSTLYNHLTENYENFDYFIYAPYLFGTTFWGSFITKKKSILLPCLHDESYAYLKSMQVMFDNAAGCIFNAKAEGELANRLYGEIIGDEVGMGFEVIEEELTPYQNLDNYILYFGRKETGKNVQVLIDKFIEYKNKYNSNLKLVVAGAGDFKDLHRDSALEREDIIDIGKVSELEKRQLMKFAKVLCLPSTNESFSIVIMESWLLSTPVLVHQECAVTKRHVDDSFGGKYFLTQKEFDDAINYFTNQDKELGENGKKYVLAKYNWKEVVKRFNNVLELITKKNERAN